MSIYPGDMKSLKLFYIFHKFILTFTIKTHFLVIAQTSRYKQNRKAHYTFWYLMIADWHVTGFAEKSAITRLMQKFSICGANEPQTDHLQKMWFNGGGGFHYENSVMSCGFT